MLKAFKKLWNDKHGNVLVIGGAALPILVGAAGLATDTIQWALWKRQLQRAADSAAIAGVYDRAQNASTTGTSAIVSHDLSLNQHTGIALVSGYPQVTFPANAGDLQNQVRVVLAVRQSLPFSNMFMSQAPLIVTSATAASTPGTDDYCVISLENTTKTGILASGSSEVILDCGMITNSVSSNSAAAQGSSVVRATVIAAAGGIQQSNNWQVDKYDPYVTAQADPYANLSPDATDHNNCSPNLGTLTGSNGSGSNWSPGCYSGIDINSNRTANLAPGTYFINGGNIRIQGTLNAPNGVTLILGNTNTAANATIGTFDMNAQASLNIQAPTTGKWSGMAIYQDRRAVDSSPTGNISSSSPNKINGGSAGTVQGVLYFPKQQITYNGGGTTTASCAQIVVKRIVFTGNNGTNLSSDCGAAGFDPIVGGRRVRLVA